MDKNELKTELSSAKEIRHSTLKEKMHDRQGIEANEESLKLQIEDLQTAQERHQFETKKLEIKIKKQQQIMDDLDQEVSETQNQFRKQKALTQEETKMKLQLKKEMGQYKENYSIVEAELGDVKSKFSAMEKKFKRQTSEMEELKSQNENLRIDVEN